MDNRLLDTKAYGSALKLGAEAEAYLDTSRREPSRAVGSWRGNRSVSYPSLKMGFVVKVESAECEFPWVLVWERDPNVLEYWAQPQEIKVSAPNSKGKVSTYYYTPDFLVLTEKKILLVECKETSQLQSLAVECPGKYVIQDGKWHFPAAEAAATLLGFEHIVLTPNEIDQTLKANYLYLEDYLSKSPEISQSSMLAVKEAVADHPGLTLRQLRETVPASVDEISALIAYSHVYVDLTAARLESPDEVRVFSCMAQAQAVQFLSHGQTPASLLPLEDAGVCIGTTVHWGARHLKVENIVGETIYFSEENSDETLKINQHAFQALALDSQGSIKIVGTKESDREEAVRMKLMCIDPKYLEIANQHLLAIKDKPKAELTRSERRWMKAYEQAEREYGYGYLGLIPAWQNSGNRKGHITETTLTLLERLWANHYASGTNIGKKAFYRLFLAEHKAVGAQALSIRTISKWLARRHDYEAELARTGKGGAMSVKPFAPQVPGRAVKAEYPWARCHIDHTKLDIQVIIDHRDAKPITARIWFSALFDDYSGRILAAVFLLDPPSSRTCMLVLRKCVERWNRLPQIIVVDGGKEFRSKYFEQLVGMYGVTKEPRPSREPRFGARAERFFGTNNTLWLHHLAGNTKLMRDVRKVTKAVNPENLAVWPYDEFVAVAEEFLYVVYDQRPRETEAASPKELHESGLKLHGSRPSRKIQYDENFVFSTMPSTERGTAKVQAGRGIKIWGMYYSCPEILDPALKGAKVSVRVDPYDVSYVYVYAQNKWLKCHCHLTQELRNISLRRLRIASRCLRAKRRHGAQRQKDYEMELGAFLRHCKDREVELQAIRDNLQSGGKVISLNQVQSKRTVSEQKPNGTKEEKILPFPESLPPETASLDPEAFGEF